MDKRIQSVVPSLTEIKKLIKREKVGSGRLSSLRLHQDLNLGGTKQKKIYTPNLNVVRNKDKCNIASLKTASYHKPPTPKRRYDNHSDKNKKPKFVQSEGIFSQGIGEKKQQQNERAQGSRENNSLTVPKLNKNIKNRMPNPIMYDDESESDSDNDYEPILLPLDCNKDSFANKFSIKPEATVKIKIEKPDDNNSIVSKSAINCDNTNVKVEKLDPDMKKTVFLDDTTEYDDDNPAFSLIALPDTFLGKVWSDDGKEMNVDYSLKHLSDGYIGKICVRKSGKTEFISQNFKYDVRTEGSEGFSEMAVQFPGKESIALEPSLVSLGSIKEKLIVSPEWNTLFDRAKRKHKFYW